MLRFPMEIPGGRGFRRRVIVGAMCSKPVPGEVSWGELIILLVEVKKEVKRSKSHVLATVESIAVLFGVTPLSRNGRGRAQAAVSSIAVLRM